MGTDFLPWLRTRSEAVAALEAQAKECLASGDMDTYRALMRQKAELLAGLANEGAAYLAALPKEKAWLRDEAAGALARFSSSASMALRINSVFFMSALLFPEDHQEGQPNDLEALIASLS